MQPLSRRAFLLAGAAGAGALALVACGGGDDDSSSQGAATTSGGAGTTAASGGSTGSTSAGAGPQVPQGSVAAGQFQVVQFFPDGITAGGNRQRFPFGLGDSGGVVNEGGPAALQARVTDSTGKVVADGLTVERHADYPGNGLKRPYWPLVTELGVGAYDVTFSLDGKDLPTAAFSVSDPAKVTVLRPGLPMPAVQTPTTKDGRGVNPICTAEPACPLHEVSVADALADKVPIVLLVGTPAYCQTGICGPVLQVLTEAALGDRAAWIHAEVYTDDTLKTTTPAVQQLGLSFEPALYFVGGDGIVRERLDVIYDRVELQAALTRLFS